MTTRVRVVSHPAGSRGGARSGMGYSGRVDAPAYPKVAGASCSRRSGSFGYDDEADACGEGFDLLVGEVGDLVVGHGGEDAVDGAVGVLGDRHVNSKSWTRTDVNTKFAPVPEPSEGEK